MEKIANKLTVSSDAKALWLLYQLAHESCAYNIILAVRIRDRI